jgi:hypothetical protein
MLPKILYELMPVLYVAVGFAAALLLYNSYAILSGILLLSVALVILYMRLENRTEAMERFDLSVSILRRRGSAGNSATGLVKGTPQKARTQQTPLPRAQVFQWGDHLLGPDPRRQARDHRAGLRGRRRALPSAAGSWP